MRTATTLAPRAICCVPSSSTSEPARNSVRRFESGGQSGHALQGGEQLLRR